MARELELIGAAAVAGELAGPAPERAGDGPKHAALHTECLNCGAALHGRFCHACGQSADDHHRSILHLIWEAVEGMFHLDGRLARTLPALFLRPGRLARDHFEGRRQRHVPPFRLFLVTLLLFMLALEGLVHGGGHGAGDHDAEPGHAAASAQAAPRLGQTVTIKNADGTDQTVTVPTAAQISRWTGGRVTPDQIEAAAKDDRLKPASGAHTEAASAKTATIKLNNKPIAQVTPDGSIDEVQGAGRSPQATWFVERLRKAVDNREYFTAVVFGWAHRLAVLLLPILAGFLTLLYVYKRRFYVYDHLVVSMHFLSFCFILWGVVYLLSEPARGWAAVAATFWTPVNLFLTLRGAYGSGVVGAGVKALVLWSATVASFLFLLTGLLLIALGQM